MIYLKSNISRENWFALVHKGKGGMELWVEYWIEAARDRVHNLDLDIPEHQEIYHQHVKTFIMFNEVRWDLDEKGIPKKPIINLKVYKDTAGKKTVGFGFNMDAPSSKQEWKEVFGDKISFEKVKEGLKITNEQAVELLDHQIKKRRGELETMFGSDWKLLKPNEKMSTESLYFNSPSLVRKNTKFAENIKKYIETNDPKYLKNACDEVQYNSNKTKSEGIQYRRNKEAKMLKSYECPLYSKPYDAPIPKDRPMRAEIGKTIIPRNLPGTVCKPNSKYYIWRAMNDNKVRLKHQLYDGKIFDVDNPPDIGNPGDDYNCRCFQDFDIPDFVNIDTSKKMIRKHITNFF